MKKPMDGPVRSALKDIIQHVYERKEVIKEACVKNITKSERGKKNEA